MIHPYTRDTITVSDKFALLASNDCCICTIETHTTEVVDQHLTHAIRIHDKKCQTILPQVTPSTAALTIIMMWKERTSIDPTQHWLEAYPLHPLVEILVACVVRDIDLLLPVCDCLIPCLVKRLDTQELICSCCKLFCAVAITHCDHIGDCLTGSHLLLCKYNTAQCFVAVDAFALCIWRKWILIKCTWVLQITALANEILYDWIIADRCLVLISTEHTIVDLVALMSTLVKCHRRLYKDACLIRCDAMKQSRYVTVVTDIVCRSCVKRNCCYDLHCHFLV